MTHRKFNKKRDQLNTAILKRENPEKHFDFIRDAYIANGRDLTKTRMELKPFKIFKNRHSRPQYVVINSTSYDEHRSKMTRLQKKYKRASNEISKEKLENAMLDHVRKWNQEHNCLKNRFDLHYLTVNTAITFALEVIEMMIEDCTVYEVALVTGRGKNSLNGVSNIKKGLIEALENQGYKVYEIVANRGMITVEL